jgi:DNA helicase II / ATP-dependent DNA helicase PcrA
VPRRGIGDTSLGHVAAFAALQGISLLEALGRAEEVPQLGTAARKKLAAFVELLGELGRDAEDRPLPDLVRRVQVKSGYLQELREEKTIEAEGRIENLEEFERVAAEHQAANPEDGLPEFLEQISLISDIDQYKEEEGSITLMTLHNAKGLEFPVVFMVGMEEGVFPHIRSIFERREDEERRLCYVGLTRAKDLLYLTRASVRYTYGREEYCRESPYINDIPPGLLEVVGSEEVRQAAVRREREQAKELADTFQAGDRVLHTKFGEGRVTEVTVSESGPEITVEFPQIGPKRLHLQYAPVTKLKD